MLCLWCFILGWGGRRWKNKRDLKIVLATLCSGVWGGRVADDIWSYVVLAIVIVVVVLHAWTSCRKRWRFKLTQSATAARDASMLCRLHTVQQNKASLSNDRNSVSNMHQHRTIRVWCRRPTTWYEQKDVLKQYFLTQKTVFRCLTGTQILVLPVSRFPAKCAPQGGKIRIICRKTRSFRHQTKIV